MTPIAREAGLWHQFLPSEFRTRRYSFAQSIAREAPVFVEKEEMLCRVSGRLGDRIRGSLTAARAARGWTRKTGGDPGAWFRWLCGRRACARSFPTARIRGKESKSHEQQGAASAHLPLF